MGGMSWVSTIDYYKYINEGINRRLGESNYARCVVFSVNFEEIKTMVFRNDWDAFLEVATGACKTLRGAGAEAIVLCANTAHAVADRLQARLDIPVIHIVDAVAAEIKRAGLDHVALLGTRFTMELDFFKDRLRKHGIITAVPGTADREFIHKSIFDELGKGILLPATKQRYQDIIGGMANGGSQGAILGCTEIPLIIKQPDSPVPVFDTTAIHAEAAVDFALAV